MFLGDAQAEEVGVPRSLPLSRVVFSSPWRLHRGGGRAQLPRRFNACCTRPGFAATVEPIGTSTISSAVSSLLCWGQSKTCSLDHYSTGHLCGCLYGYRAFASALNDGPLRQRCSLCIGRSGFASRPHQACARSLPLGSQSIVRPPVTSLAQPTMEFLGCSVSPTLRLCELPISCNHQYTHFLSHHACSSLFLSVVA